MSEFEPHEITWDPDKTKRLWDYYSSSDAHRYTYFGESVGEHFVRVLRRLGLFKRISTIVDFSCGTGAIIAHILNACPKDVSVRGYDLSSDSVDEANKRNIGTAGFRGAYKVSNYPTNIEDESVDLLILSEVIEHLDDDTLHRVMTECARILATGGRLVVTAPNNELLGKSNVMCPECGCTFHRWQHVRQWNDVSISGLLKKYRFDNVRVKKVAWGDEIIDFAFTVLRRKKTGLLAIGQK